MNIEEIANRMKIIEAEYQDITAGNKWSVLIDATFDDRVSSRIESSARDINARSVGFRYLAPGEIINILGSGGYYEKFIKERVGYWRICLPAIEETTNELMAEIQMAGHGSISPGSLEGLMARILDGFYQSVLNVRNESSLLLFKEVKDKSNRRIIKPEEILGKCFRAERRPYEMIRFIDAGSGIVDVQYYDSIEDLYQHETPDGADLRTNICLQFSLDGFINAVKELVETGNCFLKAHAGDLDLMLTNEGFEFEINYLSRYGGVPRDFKGEIMHIRGKAKWDDIYNK